MNENIKTCEICGGEHETVYNIGGLAVCDQCYNEKYFTCDCCGEIREKAGSYETEGGDIICNNCFSDYYYMCEECGLATEADYSKYIDDITICRTCYDELKDFGDIVEVANDNDYPMHYRDNCSYNEYQDIWIYVHGSYNVCDECGQMYIDDLLENPHPELFICGECLENYGGQDLSDLLLPYHSGEVTKKLNTRGYGIELEVAHINNFNEFKKVCDYHDILTEYTGSRNSVIKAEADGSLDNGAEFISSIMRLDQVIKYFVPLLNSLQGLCISHNYSSGAGMHINISYDLFEDEYHIRRFIYLLQSNRKFFYTFSRRTDSQDRWSKLFTKGEIFRQTGDKTKRTVEFIYRRNGKYSAFNFKSSCLELRQIRGTLNVNTFKATILFISDLVAFSRYESNYNKFDLFVQTEANRHPEIKKYLEQRELI